MVSSVRAQVCDFGLALTVEDATASVRSDKRGTAQYAAPELLRNGSLCRSSDVYSFGMIAWHLVSAGSRDADMTDAQICYQARPLSSEQHARSLPFAGSSRTCRMLPRGSLAWSVRRVQGADASHAQICYMAVMMQLLGWAPFLLGARQ